MINILNSTVATTLACAASRMSSMLPGKWTFRPEFEEPLPSGHPVKYEGEPIGAGDTGILTREALFEKLRATPEDFDDFNPEGTAETLSFGEFIERVQDFLKDEGCFLLDGRGHRVSLSEIMASAAYESTVGPLGTALISIRANTGDLRDCTSITLVDGRFLVLEGCGEGSIILEMRRLEKGLIPRVKLPVTYDASAGVYRCGLHYRTPDCLYWYCEASLTGNPRYTDLNHADKVIERMERERKERDAAGV